MTNNEFNCYLKTLEEVHAKMFLNDKGYLDRCKANKDLSPRDYKIHVNHGLSEYFDKYGKKLKNGKVFAYTKDELWLMNKRSNYWKIPNDSKFIYFEVPVNLKPLWVSLASLFSICVLAGAATAGYFYFKNRPTNTGGGGEGGGGGGEEEDPSEPTPIKVDLTDLDVSYGNIPSGSPITYTTGIKFNNENYITDRTSWFKENVYSNTILKIGFIAMWANYTWGSNLTINAVLKGFETKSGNVDASSTSSISTEDATAYGADVFYAYTIPFSIDLSKINGLKEYLKITQIKIDFVS